MWLTLILSLFVMLVIVAAMAIGVIMGRKPISGSCGGIAALGLDTECEICGGDPTLCDGEPEDAGPSTTEFVDASRPSADPAKSDLP